MRNADKGGICPYGFSRLSVLLSISLPGWFCSVS